MDERAKDFLDIATNRPGSMTRDQNKHSGVHLEIGFGAEVIRLKNAYIVEVLIFVHEYYIFNEK